MTNRLAREKSPYLLQHAGNPVDWYPWGEEAFAEARRSDRPVFLSIGYATCHWCHVMERESFEDEAVAELMNRAFVCVKVDREERPDLDHFFMTICQRLTGSGGWPLTIVMTAEREPFFAGTYFPSNSRLGRIGMMDLVPRLEKIWRENRGEVLRTAGEIMDSAKKGEEPPRDPGTAPPASPTLETAHRQIVQHYDAANGGFGSAPKFPHPEYLRFLLRTWRRQRGEETLAMVGETLTAMRRGGIYDHVGFGFHRYSTDERWLLPHFEKMLYDQALLAIAYTEAWQATGDAAHRRTAEEILAYVTRDMQSADGGFYSAEDADSEGEEGTFYLWKLGDVQEVLEPDEAAAVTEVFGLKASGNFVDELGRASENNILHRTEELKVHARRLGFAEDRLERLLEAARKKLFSAREKRPRPLCDDKILTDWNGLMIAALAKASAAFASAELGEAARKAADFLLREARSPEGALLHRYRDSDAAIAAHLDDYAFLAWGLIELYEATCLSRYLAEALRITDEMIDLFWDGEAGGCFFSSRGAEDVPVRQKILDDGSVPAGNSVAALNLLRLSRLTGDPRCEERAAALFQAFSLALREYPAASCHLLGALEFAEGDSLEVVVAGVPGREDTEAMLAALREGFRPNLLTLLVPAGEEEPAIFGLAPFTRDLVMLEGRATAYLCSGMQCSPPVTETAALLEMLNGPGSGDGER